MLLLAGSQLLYIIETFASVVFKFKVFGTYNVTDVCYIIIQVMVLVSFREGMVSFLLLI